MGPLNVSAPGILHGFGLTRPPMPDIKRLPSWTNFSPVCTLLNLTDQVFVSSCHAAPSQLIFTLMWVSTSNFFATFLIYWRISGWSGKSFEKPGLGANDKL